MGKMLTDKQIGDGVRNVGGAVYLAAKSLGISPQTIYSRMKKSAYLRSVVEDSRGQAVDVAEQKLRQAVMNGEPWAIALTLRTIGKSRGYVERQEYSGSDGQPIEVVIKQRADGS